MNGDELETFFAQNNPPGRLGLSDFTVANKLHVTLAGETFDHRLYQFVLAFSGWRHAEPIVGGESFESLSQGLQNALWALGGVPQSSRTDINGSRGKPPASGAHLSIIPGQVPSHLVTTTLGRVGSTLYSGQPAWTGNTPTVDGLRPGLP